MKSFRLSMVSLALTAAAGVTAPAQAQGDVETRLVRCKSQECLLVTGHRDDAATAVLVNGHAVKVEGRRNWRVRLPVATVRDWSVPFARTIEVALQDQQTQQVITQKSKLPIGLMGHADLASLIIRID